MLVAHQLGEALAFFQRIGRAGVGVVVGDVAVKKAAVWLAGSGWFSCSMLARAPGLVGIQLHAAPVAMDRRMDALRRGSTTPRLRV